jgi:hypothetical protein
MDRIKAGNVLVAPGLLKVAPLFNSATNLETGGAAATATVKEAPL